MRFPPDYPELLEHIGQLVYRDLCERGVHPGIAADMALLVGDSICTEFGGTQIYVPRALTYRLSQRDAEIFREFRGDNFPQLARKYGLSEMQLRNIVRKAIEIERRRSQPALF
ncbi:Mor transcription activator family protein [Paraburkholderia sp.]|uniref:Mor transcription activator family protein n=1 Tax=Paraburkholderia sp. TaxID=1926495 RepID=UPI003D6F42A5